MRVMPTGQRDRRIVFQRATSARGALGTKSATAWETLGPRLASVRFGTSAERREAASEGAIQTATFRTLADSLTRGLTARDRIVFTGLTWDITGLAPVGRDEIEFTGVANRDVPFVMMVSRAYAAEASLALAPGMGLSLALSAENDLALPLGLARAPARATETDTALARVLRPDWALDGALLDLDFDDGRYFRASVGERSDTAPLLEYSADWGTAWDPAAMIVPGVGLTTGLVTTPSSTYATAKLTDPVFAEVCAGGSWCALIEGAVTGTIGNNGEALAGIISMDNDYLPFVSGTQVKYGPTGTPIVGDGIEININETAFLTPSYNGIAAQPAKLALQFDAATGTMTSALDGATGPSFTRAGNYAAIHEILLSCSTYQVDPSGATATMKRCTFFAPGKDQAALNALSAVPFELDLTVGTLPAAVTLSRASSGTYFDAAGVLQTAGNNVARFDHDPVSHAPLGLLIEPAATNLLTYSDDFQGADWAEFSNGTFTHDAIVAPDGTTSALRVVPTGGDTVFRHAMITVAPNTAHWLTIWLKAPVGHSFRIYNLITLEYNTVTVTSPWQRFELTFTTDATAVNNFWLQIGGAGSLAGEVHIWGVQLEAGARTTSYNHTAGAPVTRAADQLTLTVPGGISTLLVTYDDDSTDVLACTIGANLFDSSDFSRFHIKSIVGQP